MVNQGIKFRSIMSVISFFIILSMMKIQYNIEKQEREVIISSLSTLSSTKNILDSSSTVESIDQENDENVINKEQDTIIIQNNDKENDKVSSSQTSMQEISSSSSNPKTMIYITTHFSDQHIFYLTKCWPIALQHVPLLANSDIVVYLNPDERTQSIPDAIELISQTFSNQNLTIHTRHKAPKERGAIQALTDAAREGWFEHYDWIFRVNPDVIIRNDTFIQNVIHNDPNATAILVPCRNLGQEAAHTDFFGLKSNVLPLSTMLQENIGKNAENTFTSQIKEQVLDRGGERWMYDARPGGRGDQCRVGYSRHESETPITHFHVSKAHLSGSCQVSF